MSQQLCQSKAQLPEEELADPSWDIFDEKAAISKETGSMLFTDAFHVVSPHLQNPSRHSVHVHSGEALSAHGDALLVLGD